MRLKGTAKCGGASSSRFLAARLWCCRWRRMRSNRQGGSIGWGSSRSGSGSTRSMALTSEYACGGENVVIQYRCANAERERLPALAADLVRLGVDVILATGGNPTTVAAMNATTTIPIVMTTGIDPVSARLVASLARPGGNVTGLAADAGGERNSDRRVYRASLRSVGSV